MNTLLEIYTAYANGQKRQFADMVDAYGADDFAGDIDRDNTGDGVPLFTEREKYIMLKTYIIFNEDA